MCWRTVNRTDIKAESHGANKNLAKRWTNKLKKLIGKENLVQFLVWAFVLSVLIDIEEVHRNERAITFYEIISVSYGYRGFFFV